MDAKKKYRQSEAGRLRIKEQSKRYYAKHRDRLKDAAKAYYNGCMKTDEGRRKRSERSAEFRKNNPHLYAASTAKRKSAKLRATPPWADLTEIKEFYRNTPEGCHVDHIVPLQNTQVCGLHVIDNLQYLPARENIRKNNKF